jgi:DNA-binding protein H-NS
MTNIDELRQRAMETRIKFLNRLITEEEAIAELKEYIDAFNKMSIEKAKKYGVRPMKMNARKYLRMKIDLRKL